MTSTTTNSGRAATSAATRGPDAGARQRGPMNVYITVDTEVWPRFEDWRSAGLGRDLARDIDGVTESGSFGVPFQTRVMSENGLVGVFFIEALFACAVGIEPLRRIVSAVQDSGHEAQLHLHTEWLSWIDPSPLPGRTGQHCRHFTEDEQAKLIALAADNLREAGAKDVCAFRAGNYGANIDTLRALARNGIRIDTSHNTCYLDSACGLRTGRPLLQPAWVEGVYEVPISFFEDAPGHYRHAQLCAVSASEMEDALLKAWTAGWSSFVIVSHGFELIRDRKQTARPPRPDWVVIERFERLCRFLRHNGDKFRTATFAGTATEDVPAPAAPLRGRLDRTAWRVMEQLVRRVR